MNYNPNEPPPKYSELPQPAQNYPNNSTQIVPILPTAPPHSDLNPIPNYGSTVILVQEQRRPLIPVIDNDHFICPACRVGILERRFTLLGFLLAIFFFPFGIICLFILKKWKCSLCGISLGY